MKQDLFGNLTDWVAVLDLIEELSDKGELSDYQPGLSRILRYKGNWRLREEVLKRVGEIKNLSAELILQVVDLLEDDNIYYDARILAGDALVKMLKGNNGGVSKELKYKIETTVEKLSSTPQPPHFHKALTTLYSEVSS